ncbi:MAG: 8-oxo-dGTP diphosphatase [Candidatus Bipolaricaulota bacterium]|nr:MAG: 8-oxo-dGTP diphosphatase [Candidatus Bipolaricaulota bacterium]
MKQVTLCFVYREDGHLLLGLKKRGFGTGKWNGFGGKIERGESPQQAAVRELHEECGLEARPEDLDPRGTLTFFFPDRPEFDHYVHVFVLSRWRGEPSETAEMRAVWHAVADLPFDAMWDDDKYWLPLVLEGKWIDATFTYKSDNETVDTMSIDVRCKR